MENSVVGEELIKDFVFTWGSKVGEWGGGLGLILEDTMNCSLCITTLCQVCAWAC